MKKWLLAATAVVSLTAAASAANAAATLTLSSPAADGSVSGVISGTADGSGNFTDTLTFTLPSGDYVGTLSTSASFFPGTSTVNPATDINFKWAKLDGHTYSLTPTGQFEFGNIDVLLPGGSHTIQVNYDSGGKGATYSGTLAFTPAAVPEPASWAMMIAGFGVLGGMLRLRRSTAFA